MVEVLADRELADGKKTNWDRRLRLLSASCSTYARTLVSQVPVNNTVVRSTALVSLSAVEYFRMVVSSMAGNKPYTPVITLL